MQLNHRCQVYAQVATLLAWEKGENIEIFREIAKRARELNYNIIKYKSFRDKEGLNYALLKNFDFDRWMIPD